MNVRQLKLPSTLLALFLSLTATLGNASETTSANFPSRVYWGDTHVHTYLSGDAYAFANRLTPDAAYRFAKGERVIASGGEAIQLRRPLDFLLIADHAEFMGVLDRIAAGDESIPDNEASRFAAERLAASATLSEVLRAESFDDYKAAFGTLSKAKAAIAGDFDLSAEYKGKVWQRVGAMAEQHNSPGTFTTFIGYEWTAVDNGMIHRNVLFADGSGLTDQIIPHSALESNNVEDLWSFLEAYEDELGGQAIAIPHNGNLSAGAMFAVPENLGRPRLKAYIERRARWEPIVEVTQIKGDGETHPLLSPTDEYADFETWPPKVWRRGDQDVKETSYARSALKLGLRQEAAMGTNPFKFGMIGSTDSHTGLATADEDMFWGKMSVGEPSMYRALDQDFYAASGYAAVWAEENTRESLFAAMKRKETYATTGPRMLVRFFGGWDFAAGDLQGENPAEIGYEKGVPMGGDLAHAPDGKAPSFMVYAVKDPDGANLARLQIIKGWQDEKGELQERVIDIASSNEQYGTVELLSVWRDPEFDENRPAFYYARVFQIATPRWTAYDAERFGIEELPAEVPMTVQDRAYTSPIWYTPR